jgi:hypothetical protein
MEVLMTIISARRLKKLVKHDADTLKERGYGDDMVYVQIGDKVHSLSDVSIDGTGTRLILTVGDELPLAPIA